MDSCRDVSRWPGGCVLEDVSADADAEGLKHQGLCMRPKHRGGVPPVGRGPKHTGLVCPASISISILTQIGVPIVLWWYGG